MSNLDVLQKTWSSAQDYVKNGLAKSVAVGALPVFAFAFGVGTGGYNTSDFFQARGDVGYRNPYIVLRETTPAASLSASANLKLAVNILQLNLSELARSLGVSRQTVYNWMDDGNIAAENLSKIENLAAAAEMLVDYDPRKIRELLRRKVEGKTLLEAISLGRSPKVFTQQLLSLSIRDEMQRTRISQKLFSKPRKADWQDFLGIPHLSEEG